MGERLVPLGSPRTVADGCRRYRPIRITYDTRNIVLDLEIQDGWDDGIKAMWVRNKQEVQAGLVLEFGAEGSEQKLSNYRAMGPAPWSVVFEHSVLLRQVRASFAHGDFYPALVGACSLGERLLHQMVLAMRKDYVNHPDTTRRVRNGRLPNDWGSLITVLHGWGVLDEATAQSYSELEKYRHAAVHFDPVWDVDQREPALTALLTLQQIIERIFEPHGGPPRYIAGTPGASFLALASEQEPLIKRIFLPHCALVSPAHRIQPSQDPYKWIVYDDDEYPCDALTDDEFAQRVNDTAGEPS